MKKLSTFVLAVMMLFPASSLLTACSDDDDDTEEVINPEDNGDKDDEKGEGGDEGKDDGTDDNKKDSTEVDPNNPIIPQDVLEKVQEIYSAATTGPQEVTTVNQLAIITSVCAARQVEGPITITNASLNGEDMTLVTLGGTENKEGQATTMEESQLAAFGKSNDYLLALKNLFTNGTIAADKPVIVTGISLGGMIAQQILGESEIVDNFSIRAVITFGSPFTLPLDRHGIKVVRFADVNDKVPQLGESVLRSGMVPVNGMSKEELNAKLNELDKIEKISRQSKYSGLIETHALSYVEDECWSDVDFMGDAPKTNVLVLKEDMKFYPAPKSKK